MLNGLIKLKIHWLAGIILACLLAVMFTPLWQSKEVKSTFGEVKQKASPHNRLMAVEKNNEHRGLPGRNGATAGEKQSEPSTTTVNGVPVDLYLLARVIHAEARGEPLEGQVAIGAVLLNRLHDPRFPKSLQQIIFKQGEFCTVRDGQIWLQPNTQAIHAAKLAMAGWDPSGGALYFYNPAKTTSRWIWSRPVTNHIGHHVFAA